MGCVISSPKVMFSSKWWNKTGSCPHPYDKCQLRADLYKRPSRWSDIGVYCSLKYNFCFFTLIQIKHILRLFLLCVLLSSSHFKWKLTRNCKHWETQFSEPSESVILAELLFSAVCMAHLLFNTHRSVSSCVYRCLYLLFLLALKRTLHLQAQIVLTKSGGEGKGDRQQCSAMQSGPSNYWAINHLADRCVCWGNALVGSQTRLDADATWEQVLQR